MNQRSCRAVLAWLVAVALALTLPGPGPGAGVVHGQCQYEVVGEIAVEGCPPFGNAPIVAGAINDHGVVVGHYVDCAFNEKPFIWSQETGLVEIPLPQGVTRAVPMDVNNSGEIVGWMIRANPVKHVAFLWSDGIWTELPSLRNATNTTAFAINDASIIVGESANTIVGPAQACTWEKRKIDALDLPVGPNSTAFAVSDSASIVGRMGGSPTPFVPFQWQNRSATEIPTLPGTFRSEALAINQRGEVTGQSFVTISGGSVPRRSWFFSDGMLSDLGTLSVADHHTIAEDINDAGQIVGISSGITNGTEQAFFWQHGVIVELQSLVSDLPNGTSFFRAFAINDRGQIVVEDVGAIRLVVLAPRDRPLGDVNIDCVVDERDLIAVLGDWGPNKLNHLADIVGSADFQPPGDGTVDGADLAVVLGNWSDISSQLFSSRR